LNQRINDIESSNTVLETQLANKEFKAGVLVKIEELSEKQAREVKNITSN